MTLTRPRPGSWLALAMLVAAASAGPGAGAASAAPRVTVFGDSVQASFGFVPQAPRILGAGLDLRVEADVCRRLVGPGCLGGRPPSVLSLVSAAGPRLGRVVVVNVGYNDSAGAYDIPRVLRALRRGGVRTVVWVTLREVRPGYAATNRRIRAAARLSGRRGCPIVRVADWNAVSAGRAWFSSDRIHLNGHGAIGLAGVLRLAVIRALGELGVRAGRAPVVLPARIVPVGIRARRLAADAAAVWAADRTARVRLTRDGERRSRTRDRATPLGDGRRAWLAGPTAARTATGTVRVPTPGPALAAARTGSGTWFAVPCPANAAAGCPQPALLIRAGGGLLEVPVDAVPAELAGSRTALWVAHARRLDLRAAGSGRLVRTIRLTGGARIRDLAATDRGAFLVSSDGRLRLATRAGRVRVLMTGVAAVASDGRAELWALDARRGLLLRLAGDGAVLARAFVGRRPVRAASPIALTANAVWIADPTAPRLARVPRR